MSSVHPRPYHDHVIIMITAVVVAASNLGMITEE